MNVWRRIKDLGPRSRARKELDLEREIQDHLALEAEESDRHGAQRAFGNTVQVKEDVREAWGWAGMERFLQDIRYGLRQVRRNPTFSAIAIATLTLGIGANTAMFSAVDAVLIRPLPYADAGRLVMIWDDMSRTSDSRSSSRRPPNGTSGGAATRFSRISRQPSPGRRHSQEMAIPKNCRAAKSPVISGPSLACSRCSDASSPKRKTRRGVRVAVISYGLWQRRFGGSPDVLGRKIILNDTPYEVIGVMPREFYFMPARDIDDLDAGLMVRLSTLHNAWWHDVHCVARLKPGVTLQQARESMAALSLRVSAQHVQPPRGAVVTPLREELAGKTQTSLIVLLGASAAILLIACVNLANLLLSRGAVRRREVAVRAALGAGRGRLITQFLIESLVLAGFGAIAGLALAIPLMRFLETLVPETMAAVRLTLDWRVLAFSAAIAIAAGLTFGLVPALGGSRLALQEGLRDGGRGSSGARSHRIPAFAHHHRDGSGGRAADERRIAAADVSTSAAARSRHSQRKAADLCDPAVPLSRLRPARGFRQRGVGSDPRDSRRRSAPARFREFH